MEGVLKPVISLINKGSSYEEIMTDMSAAFPDMNTIELEEMLGRAIFVAECWGRLTAGKN
jgi:phage gp29-like protein